MKKPERKNNPPESKTVVDQANARQKTVSPRRDLTASACHAHNASPRHAHTASSRRAQTASPQSDPAASACQTHTASSRRDLTGRMTYCAVMTAIAVILSAAESAVPIPVPAPGVKLGLANAVTLIMLLNEKNPASALAVTAVRCVIVSLFTGAFSTLLFSLPGGLFSCIVMWLLLHFDYIFGTIGVSVAGALAHNVTQLAAAVAITRDIAAVGYAPVLLAAGTLAGIAVGCVATQVNHVIISKKR